eukprot:8191977-Prorocentrum_lima.AAC.1
MCSARRRPLPGLSARAYLASLRIEKSERQNTGKAIASCCRGRPSSPVVLRAAAGRAGGRIRDKLVT